jgi:hypothetical protein
MENILNSLWLLVSNPPLVPDDLSFKSIEELERLRSSLVPFRNADLHLLFWATVLVTIGVLMEVAEIQHDVREAVRIFIGREKLGDLRPFWKIVVSVGWLLVAVGLGLEWFGDAKINSVAEDLDRINEAIVEQTREVAITAGEAALAAQESSVIANVAAGEAQKKADTVTTEVATPEYERQCKTRPQCAA